MTISITYYVMLLSHTIGDFYFQSDKLAEKKNNDPRYKYTLLHGLYYTITTAIIMAICIKNSRNKWLLILILSLAHLIIDAGKNAIIQKHIMPPTGHIFFVDQSIHLISLICIWLWIGKEVEPYSWVSQEWTHLPYLPITMILGILLLLKPASLCVVHSGVLNSSNKSKKESSKRVGKYIGYLERIVIYGILIYGDLSAIGFVMTAKSLARFSEAKGDENAAEYYILGTLLSIAIAIITAVLLGHCTHIN